MPCGTQTTHLTSKAPPATGGPGLHVVTSTLSIPPFLSPSLPPPPPHLHSPSLSLSLSSSVSLPLSLSVPWVKVCQWKLGSKKRIERTLLGVSCCHCQLLPQLWLAAIRVLAENISNRTVIENISNRTVNFDYSSREQSTTTVGPSPLWLDAGENGGACWQGQEPSVSRAPSS